MTTRDKQVGPAAPGRGVNGDDDQLISLLYGELTGPDAARERERIAADPALSSRVDDLERVRALFGGMAEEEPPARVSALLMTEAARTAPRRGRDELGDGAQAGFWARLISWLQPIARHPALAAAASVVLVAGLAGVLYLRKGELLTETQTVRTGADEAPPPPPAPPAGVEVGGVAPVDAFTPGAAATQPGASPQSATEAAAQGGDLADRQEKSAERSREGTGKPVAHAADKAPPSGKVNAASPRAKPAKKADLDPAVYGMAEKETASAPDEGRGSASSLGASQGGGGAAASDALAPAPPTAQASEPSPAPSAEQAQPRSPPSQNSKSAAGSVDSSSSKVKQLFQRAIDAALDRRCADVRSLDGEVRRLDRRFDEQVFRRDARLQVCLRSTGPTKK